MSISILNIHLIFIKSKSIRRKQSKTERKKATQNQKNDQEKKKAGKSGKEFEKFNLLIVLQLSIQFEHDWRKLHSFCLFHLILIIELTSRWIVNISRNKIEGNERILRETEMPLLPFNCQAGWLKERHCEWAIDLRGHTGGWFWNVIRFVLDNKMQQCEWFMGFCLLVSHCSCIFSLSGGRNTFNRE